MRIGVTSQNFRTITAHAGRARRFVIFEEFPDGQIQETGKLDLPMEMNIHDYPRDAAHPIDGIDVLITASCGDGFARSWRPGHPGHRHLETDPIEAVKAVLSGAPLPPAAVEEEDDKRQGCGCNCSGGGNH